MNHVARCELKHALFVDMLFPVVAVCTLVCLLLPCSHVLAEEAPNGLDLWDVDGIHWPDYAASSNLIQNPSFEAGFRYWNFAHFPDPSRIVPLDHALFQAIDGNEAYSGSHSLCLPVSSERSPLGIGTFPLPLMPDVNYTLSFWAKTNVTATNELYLRGRTALGNAIFPGLSGGIYTFDPNSQWQRFEVTITPTDRFVALYFEHNWSTGQTGYIWIDDVQLEEGNTATSFTQAPLAAELVSSERGNFLEFGHDPNFNLVIRTTNANASGDVTVFVEDFFFNTIFSDAYEFTTNDSKEGIVNLDGLSDTIVNEGLRGVFIVTAVFDINGVGDSYTDYFRFSVMNFLENTHKNKNLFNLTFVFQPEPSGPEMGRFLERERAIGFGAYTYEYYGFGDDCNYSRDQERWELAESYGFTSMGRGVLKGNTAISEGEGTYYMGNINYMISPTEANLAQFADICQIKATNRYWNDMWWFTGESNAGCQPLESNDVAFAKFLIATYQGIKAGNPNAKVLIEGGPWEISPATIEMVKGYIQETNQISPNAYFDGAACHHYRHCPENPDLDSDIAAFLAMLGETGHPDWPLYINEGGCYPSFRIPADTNSQEPVISPYMRLTDENFIIGPLSYHCGRAERTSAAFSARNWLVGLKYQDRIPTMEDFRTPNRCVDIDFTPKPYDKIPNTLGRLLGNASFVKDITFGCYCRGYLFRDDDSNAPIAVIWCYKDAIDKEWQNDLLYAFDFGSQNLQFIDLMENEVDCSQDVYGRTLVPVSSFPLFIKGVYASGYTTETQLCDSLTNGERIVVNDVHNNGGFMSTSYGFWYETPESIPPGWTETHTYMYTTATRFLQTGSEGVATCNTGEQVLPDQRYALSADLGGGTNANANVLMYATEHADGTGTKVLLASIQRLGQASDGWTLFPVTNAGVAVDNSYADYYIQVVITGMGYYDNVVVTSKTATMIMDGTHHNGSFTYGPTGYGYGYWCTTSASIPTGWEVASVCPTGPYTTATRWILANTNGTGVNNTGELVQVGHTYIVIADLGGNDSMDATVRVYATQNSDGTGTKVLLASVNRPGHNSDGYTLFHVVGMQGTPAAESLEGYYIQVMIGGPSVDHTISGYYDNINVTSFPAPPGQASNPSPANSATGVSTTRTLSWTAGSGTTSHDVYFGTSQSNVIYATHLSNEYKGNQAGTTYAPGALSNSTTYYWRVDEVGDGSTTKGTTWSFTTTAPVPTFVAAGTVTSNTTAITPALPAGIATNDILLLFLETSNQAISISNQNGGTWTQVTNSPQYCGTAAGTTGARLTVFWSRYNGTQGAPTTSDSGNHQLGRMIAIRGAVSSGNPLDVTAGGIEAVSDTSGSIPGATTTVANTLVVTAIATALPDATGTANFSNWTNANLASLTERTDNTVTAGNGGGLGVATGAMASDGAAYGNTAVTLGSSAYKGMMSIAIKP